MLPFGKKLRFGGMFGLAMALVAISSARAQDSGPESSTPDSAQELAVQGLQKLMQAIELFVKSVPQYSAPEILPNGDIIIRRVHPDAPTPPKKPDDTHT
jgi:hypothetical protein